MKDIAVTYHYVRSPDWRGIHPLRPELFAAQLDWLASHYDVVGLDEYGRRRGAKPRCIITFDDATKDQYEVAFPILQQKGLPAYFTLMSGIFESCRVPIMHLTHAVLSFFSDEEIWEELTQRFDMSRVSEHSSIYHYERDLFRRYNKYALNFLLSEDDSRSVLEPKLLEKYSTWDDFIDAYYINLDEWGRILKAGMTVGVHAVHHSPYTGDAQHFYECEIAPCRKFIYRQFGVNADWYTPAFGGGTKYREMITELQPLLEATGFKGGFTTIAGYNEGNSFWFNRFDCNQIPPVGNVLK